MVKDIWLISLCEWRCRCHVDLICPRRRDCDLPKRSTVSQFDVSPSSFYVSILMGTWGRAALCYALRRPRLI